MQNCQAVVNEISRGIWRCLKRDRDIGRKAVLSDVTTAFTCTPALMENALFVYSIRYILFIRKLRPW